jgi:hypothetical protein
MDAAYSVTDVSIMHKQHCSDAANYSASRIMRGMECKTDMKCILGFNAVVFVLLADYSLRISFSFSRCVFDGFATRGLVVHGFVAMNCSVVLMQLMYHIVHVFNSVMLPGPDLGGPRGPGPQASHQ